MVKLTVEQLEEYYKDNGVEVFPWLFGLGYKDWISTKESGADWIHNHEIELEKNLGHRKRWSDEVYDMRAMKNEK
jgi:hypothetical protein